MKRAAALIVAILRQENGGAKMGVVGVGKSPESTFLIVQRRSARLSRIYHAAPQADHGGAPGLQRSESVRNPMPAYGTERFY